MKANTPQFQLRKYNTTQTKKIEESKEGKSLLSQPKQIGLKDSDRNKCSSLISIGCSGANSKPQKLLYKQKEAAKGIKEEGKLHRQAQTANKIVEESKGGEFLLPPPKQISLKDSSDHRYPPLVYAWCPEADSLPQRLSCTHQQEIAQGIKNEGKVCGQAEIANKIAEEILQDREVFSKIREDSGLLSALLRKPAVLLKTLNKALREEDLSRSKTLGPLAYVMNQCVRSCSDNRSSRLRYQKIAYKGANLSKQELSNYKTIAGSSCPIFCWNSFVSASKDSAKAKAFGKVLFVISMHENYGAMDISDFCYSKVLFPAGSRFRITKIEKDSVIHIQRIEAKKPLPGRISSSFRDIDNRITLAITAAKALVGEWMNAKGELNSNKSERISSSFANIGATTTSASTAEKRLVKEWMNIKNELNNNNCFSFYDIFVIPSREISHEWKALIPGPKDTCYDGAIFQAQIRVPSEYPYRAPAINFVSRIWHPNISADNGKICMDRLNEAWSPQLGIVTVAVSIQSLLSEFNTQDPTELYASEQIRHNFQEFRETVGIYNKNDQVIGDKVKNLMRKGANPQKAKLTLMIADFNEDIAEQLCQKDVDETVEIWWQSVEGWKV